MLPGLQANTVIADKAFDADARVIEPLLRAGKTVVIPPKKHRKVCVHGSMRGSPLVFTQKRVVQAQTADGSETLSLDTRRHFRLVA